jgi:membrane protease YdiL (CAAX protease family)
VEFLLIGLMAEELLFGGAIYELAERAFGDTMTWAPVVVTAVLFSLEHFQFHGFHVTPGSLFMAGFTLPMGGVLGLLRRYSGSIWPGAVVHLLSGVPWVYGP